MAFGQPAGPPANGSQLGQLVRLIERAGYTGFREARHPLGLTQRQAAGRFTVEEADSLIERLEAAEAVRDGAAPEPPNDVALTQEALRLGNESSLTSQRARRSQRRVEVLAAFDDDLLVTELERRGWCCIPPISSIDGS